VNSADNNGCPLHRCCEGNNDDGVDGVSTNSSKSSSGMISVAQELLNHGAKVNCKNRTGRTPLHIATQKGNVDLVKALLIAGANKTDRDNLGMTPYDFAEGKPHIRHMFDSPSPMPSPQAQVKATIPNSLGGSGKLCGSCGTKLSSANAKFCSSCGTKF